MARYSGGSGDIHFSLGLTPSENTIWPGGVGGGMSDPRCYDSGVKGPGGSDAPFPSLRLVSRMSSTRALAVFCARWVPNDLSSLVGDWLVLSRHI